MASWLPETRDVPLQRAELPVVSAKEVADKQKAGVLSAIRRVGLQELR